jgi:dihydroorotase-like cyclic amidohydrolase
LRSRSRNTAFEGARLSGKVVLTMVGGAMVYRHD